MKAKQLERGIHELYVNDPDRADRLLWERQVDPVTRRGFLKKSSLLAMSAVVGAHIPFAENMPGGLIPMAIAGTPDEPLTIPGKPGLVVLEDRPINAETPAHLLDDEITPANRLFVRNNGVPPKEVVPTDWTLEISGESCEKSMTFSLADLKRDFKSYTYQLQLECGGNGRSAFNPPTSGNQWTFGAVGCPQWTGVRLKEVLEKCGIKKDAVYIGYYGADTHLSGDPNKIPISRGVPIAKALEDETLIAWAVNGENIPLLNGHPLRLVCSGWAASTSGKWLKRIVIRNQVHDGEKMMGDSYRVPCEPVAPGSKVADDKMCIIESMPVKSIITYPQTGISHPVGEKLALRGHAWAGDLEVKELYISNDFGATWVKANLKPPVNRFAWQHWTAAISFPMKGYYEIWARAVDSQGRSQPMVVPNWNPKGYLNNACHRIGVTIV